MNVYHQRFKTTDERFADRYTVQAGGCWQWNTGQVHPQFRVSGKHVRASHYAWERENGPVPSGLCVCHTCDNPLCVNVAHLFLGTHTDNMRDKVAKGRSHHPRGTLNGRAKITPEIAAKIRAEYRPRVVSQQSLANRYGIAQGTVSQVVRGEIWA